MLRTDSQTEMGRNLWDVRHSVKQPSDSTMKYVFPINKHSNGIYVQKSSWPTHFSTQVIALNIILLSSILQNS